MEIVCLPNTRINTLNKGDDNITTTTTTTNNNNNNNNNKLWRWKCWRSADKSLARPGRKQATATKLGIYSAYSPRSSIYFLDRCSNFCKTFKKNSERCPSNQVSAAAITSAPKKNKWRSFNRFFRPGNGW